MRRRLYFKLICAFLAISLLPLLFFGIFSGRIYDREITNRTIAFSASAMSNVGNEVNNFWGNIETMGSVVLTSNTQTAINALRSDDSHVKIDAIMELNGIFEHQSTSVGLTGTIDAVYIIDENGRSLYESTGTVENNFNFLTMGWFASQTRDSTASVIITNPHTRPYFTRHPDNVDTDTISYIRRILDLNSPSKTIGYLMIDIPVASVAQILRPLLLSEDSSVMVIDSTGGLVYSLGRMPTTQYSLDRLQEIETDNYTVVNINGTETLLFAYMTSHFGWHVVSENSVNLVAADNRKLNWIVMVLLVAIFLFAAAASFIIAYGIVRPVSKLKSAMLRVKGGDLNTIASVCSNDEIGELSGIFNDMIRRIRNLVEEVFTNKIKEQEARLNALEAQINPHFLYNTLENIRSIADLHEEETIEQMTVALSNMFRYNAKSDHNPVSVKDELEHVKNYLAIIQVRYNNTLEVSFELDGGVLEHDIIKLILQPLVENAVVHGLSKKLGDRRLTIRGHLTSDTLEMTVTDNGLGMTEERLSEVICLLAQNAGHIPSTGKGSIGLANVNDRIRLRYGDAYGLIVNSQENFGTTVKIILPC